MLTLRTKTLALMNLGLSTLQMRETRNDDDLRPITPTGGSSQITSPIGPTVPASVRGVTAVLTWGYMSTAFCPSLKPKAVLQLQMSSHVPGRLCHLEARRKPP